ncbi:MAG: glycosyltransferase family 9 protein [Candidatus Omnitrophota bacterium]
MKLHWRLLRKFISLVFLKGFLPNIKKTNEEELRNGVKNILILQLQFLGDSLIFTPTLKAIQAAHPNCKIDAVVNDVSYQVYKDNPNIDKLYLVKGWKCISGSVPLVMKDLWLMHKIGKKKHYDCVLMDITEVAFEYSLLAFATGIKNRIGFKFQRSNYLNTYEIDVGPLRNINFLKLNLKLAALLGAQDMADASVELCWNKSDTQYVDELVGKNFKQKTLIGINPFAKKKVNRWGYDRFGKLINLLGNRYKDSNIVLIGGKEHKQDIPMLLDGIGGKVTSLVGEATLSQAAYLVSTLDLFITLDTGPMHLCAINNTPTICLESGRTFDKQWTYDYPSFKCITHKVDCSPCHQFMHCPEEKHKCMELISVEEVFLEAQNFLRKCGVAG